jgi:hypothetical protein
MDFFMLEIIKKHLKMLKKRRFALNFIFLNFDIFTAMTAKNLAISASEI